jgi:hypothetical protein
MNTYASVYFIGAHLSTLVITGMPAQFASGQIEPTVFGSLL